MRVISGTSRGSALFSLDGSLTRPTTDRVKEAMFSMIQFDIPESTVLDLFAGSGALGIEALSRGARHCDFVEQNPDAAEIVKKNLEKTKLYSLSGLFNTTARQYLSTCKKKYDIILLDPPYGKKLCDFAISEIIKLGLASENALFVCETAADEPSFSAGRRKRYGKTAVTVIRADEITGGE